MVSIIREILTSPNMYYINVGKVLVNEEILKKDVKYRITFEEVDDEGVPK